MKINTTELHQLCIDILKHHGFNEPHQQSIANNLMTAQLNNSDSHGLWRLLGLIETLKNNKIDPQAQAVISQDKGAIIRVDANHGPATTAHQVFLPQLTHKAKELGIALLAINHCFHFTALWVELEQLSKQGLVALNTTTSHAWVAPFGSQAPLLGTNPLAFACPRLNPDEPYVFDFATSATARGEIQLHERKNQPLDDGLAIDKDGKPTNDPTEALAGAMLPFGAHKGSALSTMIELLAGPIIGDLNSQESMDFADNTASLPLGGELIIAIDPEIIIGEQWHQESQAKIEHFLNQFNESGARLPSQRRFAAKAINQKTGTVEIDQQLYQQLIELSQS